MSGINKRGAKKNIKILISSNLDTANQIFASFFAHLLHCNSWPFIHQKLSYWFVKAKLSQNNHYCIFLFLWYSISYPISSKIAKLCPGGKVFANKPMVMRWKVKIFSRLVFLSSSSFRSMPAVISKSGKTLCLYLTSNLLCENKENITIAL